MKRKTRVMNKARYQVDQPRRYKDVIAKIPVTLIRSLGLETS